MKEKTFQEFDIPLHDIKPIIEVQEYSFYYLIGLVGLGFIVLSFIIYFLYLWYKKRNAYNIKKEHLSLLRTLDFSDTKNAAYAISIYASSFKNDSPEHEELFKNLNDNLEFYKYRKNVNSFDEETLQLIADYKDLLGV